MRLILISCFALLCWQLSVERSVAQNSQVDVVRYIESWQQYRSISYEAKVLQKPEVGAEGEIIEGLQVRQTLKVMYDFRTEDYKAERTYTLASKNSLTRELRSHVGDELRGYTDEESPKFKSNPKVSAGAGIVDHIVDRSEFAGPEMLMGSPNLTSAVGQRVRLSALFEQSEPIITDVGSLRLPNAFHWPASTPGVYDIDVRLDSARGYLPNHISFIYQNRVQNNDRIHGSYTVTKFFQDKKTQLWVPVDFFYSGANGELQTRVLVDEHTVVMNECPLPEKYRLEFPSSKVYVNQLTRQRMRDGQVIDQLAPLPKPFGKTEKSRWLYSTGVFLIAIAAIIFGFYMVKHRRSAVVLLCIYYGSCSFGCNRDSLPSALSAVTPRTQASEPTYVFDKSGEKLLEFPGGRERTLKILIDPGSKTGFSFPMKNVGNAECIFDANIRTTCGCTMASLSGLRLAPGESTEIRGQVDMSASSGEKAVQLTVVLHEPQQHELVFIVHAIFEGDWTVSERSVTLQGQIGERKRNEIEVSGKPEALRGIRFRRSGDIEVEELVQSESAVRRFSVSGVPRSLVSQEAIGEIVFEHENATPRSLNVLISASAETKSSWKPSVILVRRGAQREFELSLTSEDRLVEVVCKGEITIDELTTSPDGSRRLFSCRVPAEPKNGAVVAEETAVVSARLKRGDFSYILPIRVVVHD